jgi:hypothetical protein
MNMDGKFYLGASPSSCTAVAEAVHHYWLVDSSGCGSVSSDVCWRILLDVQKMEEFRVDEAPVLASSWHCFRGC